MSHQPDPNRISDSSWAATRTGKVIRFGIMCNGKTLEEWQLGCVKRLLKLDYVLLDLLIIDDGRWTSSLSLRKTPFDRWLYILLRRTWFKRAPRRHVDASQFFSGIERIEPRITLKGKFSQYFDRESLDIIKSHNLDFILRFGFNIIRGEVLTAARYGVWSFHHDDETKYRGSPSGFWEIYRNDPVSGAVLQRLTEALDGGVVLKRGHLDTVTHSYVENIRAVFEESATWPAQICRDIYNVNAHYLFQPPSKTDAPIYYPPSNIQMLSFLAKLGRNKAARWFHERFRTYQWNVGVVHDRIEKFAEGGFEPSIECGQPPYLGPVFSS